ncbi:MAG: X-Pro dipeptidyl-peptidase [Bacteroidota bacterium]|nr:MAG: X-Pro dipeptidyl-peptidase [Bacteroidota bacterium]
MRFLTLLLLLICTLSFAQTEMPSEVYPLITQYEADRGSLQRFYFIQGSPERRERFTTFYKDYLTRLQQLPFESFSTGGKVDYIMMKRIFENELALLAQEEKEAAQIAKLTGYANPVYEIEKNRRRGIQLKSEEVAQQLSNIRKEILAAQKKLSQEPNLTVALANRAAEIIGGQQAALKSAFEFYDGYDPQFSWWVKRPYQQLDSAMSKYAGALKNKIDPATRPKDDGSGIIGNPIGREELLRLLQLDMIPYSPEELVNIANKEFAWCDAELLKASREMGFGDNWKAAQEKVKQAYVPAGQQPEAMLKLYEESVAFLKKNDLITIPPIAEETWRMRMMPPKQQLISPFFLGGEVLQIAYPTDAMSHEDKLMSMRGNNPHFSRATVHHELIAGHHLQGFMNNRYKAYRHYRTPFWTEGWALYWELILWDMNFPRGPEDKIGMLFWRMHRCARIIFSLNYHLGKWTPQQCIDFLVDRVGFERANAEAEVRRSFTANYGPLYQLAYMTGAFQFYALKKELVDSGKMTYKQYHDAVLRENSMPVEMVRAILTNQPLTRDFKTNWKFYK